MIAYLDTSALVKLVLVDEEGGDLVEKVAEAADGLCTSRVTHPEARSALAAGVRLGRLSNAQHRSAKSDLLELLSRFDMIELSGGLAELAGEITERSGLRALDAIQLASSLVAGDDVVMATFDEELSAAARSVGMRVIPATR